MRFTQPLKREVSHRAFNFQQPILFVFLVHNLFDNLALPSRFGMTTFVLLLEVGSIPKDGIV